MMAILMTLRLWEGVLSLIITMAWTSVFVYVARQHLQVDGPKHLSQWHQQLNIPCYKFLSSSLGEVTSIWTCMYIHSYIRIVYIQSHTHLCIGLCIGLVLAETCIAQWLTLYNMYGPALYIQGEWFISWHYGSFLARMLCNAVQYVICIPWVSSTGNFICLDL